MISSFRQPDAARGARLPTHTWRLSDPKMYVSANQMFGSKAEIGRQIAASLRGIGSNIRQDRIREEQQSRQDAIRAQNQSRQDRRDAIQEERFNIQNERAKQRLAFDRDKFGFERSKYDDYREDRDSDKDWQNEERQFKREDHANRQRSNNQTYQRRQQDMNRSNIDQEIKIAERFRQRASKVRNSNEWGHLIDRFRRLGFNDVDQYQDFETGKSRVLSEMDNSLANLKKRRMELQNQKLERDLEPSEGLKYKSLAEVAKTTQSLRKEFEQRTRDFRELQDFNRSIKSAPNQGPGNLTLIFSFMKMLDPRSVVRSDEQASVRNAGGVPQSIRSLWNKALTGGMSDEVMQQFKTESQRIIDIRSHRYNQDRKWFVDNARKQKLDPNQVVPPQASASGSPPPLALPPGVTIEVEED